MMKYHTVDSKDKGWLQTWGPKSRVVEKPLFTKEDSLPISVTLQYIPTQKEVVSPKGYKLHSHGETEIGYIISGHSRIHLEGIGVIEVKEGTLISIPAGTKHAVTETIKDTLAVLYCYPPDIKPNGPAEEEAAPSNPIGEFRLIRSQDREWIYAWGTKTDVAEKRYLTKEDNFPLSFLLRRIPVQKEVVSAEGYKVHSHPALEIGYVISGGIRVYVEGVGEHDFAEGMIVCNPVGTKHAAIEAMHDTLIAVVNIPPFGRTPAVVEKQGAAEEG